MEEDEVIEIHVSSFVIGGSAAFQFIRRSVSCICDRID
jgi:hypothetical protein